MDQPKQLTGYLLAGVMGAVGGGLFVAIATKAIPKIISGMMEQMMPRMIKQMKESGCSPET